MKKEYFAPEVETIEIETSVLLAGSGEAEAEGGSGNMGGEGQEGEFGD